FETAGYGTTAWLRGGNMATTLVIRGFLSVGGHIVWTAMAGAALMLAQSPDRPTPSLRGLRWRRCLPLLGVAVGLHTVWDFLAFVVDDAFPLYMMLCGLIAVAWVFVVRLINSGLRQEAQLPPAAAPDRGAGG
ncbi:MAG: PrsW family intramembrane metalloprotease, partial [Propionibacteriaceae bacterium]|nr:PrsW family intramembrane metalloprotease [Propionibacteriaceae bacterium]